MANPGSYFSEKARLRQSIGEQLWRMNPDERRSRSLALCAELKQLLAGTKSVALFAPRPTEPDLDLLWELDLLKERLVAYPRCDGERLVFFAVSGLQELRPGRFGIREPDPKYAVQHLDAIVLPGLAFTQTGIRIGQGAGFYDRFLENPRAGTIKIGVCFDFQVVAKITSEKHDVNVDLVVSA
jgi:5-formyltetrahydrofolate cyclo-ligase